MSWSEVANFVMIAFLGGMFGGVVMGMTAKKVFRDNLDVLDSIWREDVTRIQQRLNGIETKLSPKSV